MSSSDQMITDKEFKLTKQSQGRGWSSQNAEELIKTTGITLTNSKLVVKAEHHTPFFLS